MINVENIATAEPISCCLAMSSMYASSEFKCKDIMVWLSGNASNRPSLLYYLAACYQKAEK